MAGVEERCPSCGGVGLAGARQFGRVDAAGGPVFVVPLNAGEALTEPCKGCGGRGWVPVASEKRPPAVAQPVGEGGDG